MKYIPVTSSEELASRADVTLQRLLRRFLPDPTGQVREHDPLRPGDRPAASLWPYTGLISALNALAAIPGKKPQIEPALRNALSGLDAYLDASALPAGYDSYPRAEGGGQKYYDDNEWVGLELIRAYRLLGDGIYRERAAEVFQFAISGWSEALGGGIYWREGDDSTKNTCSNAPAAVLALQLYQDTGQPYYLDWAVKILDWLKQLKSPGDGVYWDNLSKNGSVDRSTYTYNTGTVIHANALLHAVTGLTQPLAEARSLAEASCAHFARQVSSGARLYPQTPWFNAVLARGYLALAAVDPQTGQACMDLLRGYLDYAWQAARGQDELFTPDASGQVGRDDPHRWLLDQAGMVELYALAAAGPYTLEG